MPSRACPAPLEAAGRPPAVPVAVRAATSAEPPGCGAAVQFSQSRCFFFVCALFRAHLMRHFYRGDCSVIVTMVISAEIAQCSSSYWVTVKRTKRLS